MIMEVYSISFQMCLSLVVVSVFRTPSTFHGGGQEAEKVHVK